VADAALDRLLSAQRQEQDPAKSNLLIIALMVVLINLAVDVSYAWLNPRLRFR
jgi:ABC-type dipeptide/oligopeptide/nickel transport system permease component